MSSEGGDDSKVLADAKKLPWEERTGHKNWKVRQDAYVDIAAACKGIHDPKDAKLREFGHLLKKAVSDSNAAAQEKGLDALISFQEAADVETASRFSKEICDALATKCFGGRSMTIDRCRTAFLFWVELEAVDVVLDAMDKAIKNKVAKQVLPAVDVVYGALSQFGPKVVPPKRIVKMLQELLNHTDNNVRRIAKDLTVELCRWIGKDALKRSLFDNLKKQAMEDIEKLLDTVEGDPKVMRRIRSEMDKEEEEVAPAAHSGAGKGAAADEEEAPMIDDYDLADPVDVLALLAKTNFFEGIKSAKWSERKSAVAELTAAADKVRISPGDFSEVHRALKKLLTDNNVAVAVEAIQAATNLAKGLRASYSSGAKFLLPTLLEKLKDKKASLVNAVKEALQAFYKSGCLTFVDLWEDAVAATKNKVPGARAETLAWLGYCVENTKKALLQKSIKDLAPVLVESLNDTAPEVRDAGFAALASLIKKVGMKPVERFTEQVDDIRKKKLIEMVVAEEAAGPQRSQSGPPANGNPTLQADLSRVGSGPSLLSKRPVLRPTNAVNQASVKGAVKKPAGATGAKKGGAAPVADAAPAEQVEPEPWSEEVILEKAAGVVPAQSMELMKSGAWKDRVEGVGALKEDLEKPGRDLSAEVEAIVRYVCLVPGLADKNVTVSQKVLEVLTGLADKAPKFPKKCAVLCIAGVVERVGDLKTRLQAVACLTAFSEAVGPRFVFERGSSVAGGHKNLKVLEGFLTWTMGAVVDFGSAEFDLKELINFCKTVGLASSNAACRSATLKLIGVLHKAVGPDLKSFFLDLKQAQLDLVNQEFEKNKYEGPSGPPARVPRGSAGSSGGASTGGGGALPREDISGKISGTLIEKLGDGNWKIRQESLEAVNTILEEAHNRVLPNGTSELFAALKGRLSDPNKNLILLAITITANVASAMGPPADKSSKGLLGDVLKCLSDPKKPLRDAVLKALEAWVAAIQLEKAVPYVGAAITDPKLSADGRKDLLDWLQRRISAPPQGEAPLEGPQGLLKACASGLQDKAVEVRRGAEALLAELVKAFGSDNVTRAAKSELQSQALAVVAPILDRHRSATPTGAEPLAAQSRDGAGPVVRSGTAGAALTKGAKTPTPAKGKEGIVPSKSPMGGAQQQQQQLGRAESDLQSLPLFNLRESIKVERELQLRTRARQMDDARPEIIQELEVDSSRVFREDLLRRMFSPDFRMHLEAFDILHNACHQEPKDAFEVVDLILRWVLLRLSDNNTACFLKALEFLSSLVEILRVEGCILTDVEASLLVPSLVDKLGHNMSNVREKVRDLVVTLAYVCPASRIFHALVECLRHSKSSRTRVECVELMDIMMENSGLEIMGSSKVPLVTLASLTSERDNEVRRVALNALCTAYKMQGEDIWKSLGKLTAAQVGLIQDKFKWKAREMEKRGEYVPGPAALRQTVAGGYAMGGMGQADLRTSQESLQYQLMMTQQGQGAAFGAHPAGYGAPDQAYYAHEQAVQANYIQQQLDQAAYMHQEQVPAAYQQQMDGSVGTYAQEVAPRATVTSSTGSMEPGSWKEGLHMVESAETGWQLLVALRYLCGEIDRTREQDDRTAALEYSFDAERLISSLVYAFVDTFQNQGIIVVAPEEYSKTCKYILNCMLALFRQRITAQAVSEQKMRELMEALSVFLLDERTKKTPEDADNANNPTANPNPSNNTNTNVCKAVNVLVLRILNLAPPNVLFAAFIQILRPGHLVNGLHADDVRGPDGTPLSVLIVKCLLRMSRQFLDYVDALDFDKYLLDLHRYFSDFTPDELRRRLTSDERTLTILKKLVYDAVAVKGPAIKGHLSLIPLDARPPPFILTQIDLALQQVLEEQVAYQQMTAGMQGVSMEDHMPVVDMAATGAPMEALAYGPDPREQLMNIMRIIHDRKYGAQGLVQLYSFTHRHPEVDVFSELHLISDQSREYLRKGLMAVDRHLQAGHDASTFTMTGELAMDLQKPAQAPPPVAARPSLAEAAPRMSRAASQQQEQRTSAQQQEQRTSRHQQEQRSRAYSQPQEQQASTQLREQPYAQQQEYRTSAMPGEERRSTQQQEFRNSAHVQEQQRSSAVLQEQPPSATGGDTRDVIASLRARLIRVHSGGAAAE